MESKEFGTALTSMIDEVVAKIAAKQAKELVSVEQVRSMEDRIKSIEVTLNHIMKKSGGNPLRKSNRGRKPGAQRICIVGGCQRPVVARKMCSMHYQRARSEDIAAEQMKKKKARKTGGRKSAR